MKFEKGGKKVWVDSSSVVLPRPITRWWAELVYIASANKAGCLHLMQIDTIFFYWSKLKHKTDICCSFRSEGSVCFEAALCDVSVHT